MNAKKQNKMMNALLVNTQKFFAKNWFHFVAILGLFLVVLIVFQPTLEGYMVKQHDMESAIGLYQEVVSHQEKTDEYPLLWTDAMFSGMPMIQIWLPHPGNIFYQLNTFNAKLFVQPIYLVFLHALCFYLMALLLRIRPIIAVLGALAYSFASYEIIIIQAGHLTKSMASAYLPLLLGLFVYAYQKRSWLAVVFSSVVMALEVASNHPQVTYYMVILLVALGIYFFVEAIRSKQLRPFFQMTAGLLFAYLLAGLLNSPNMLLTYNYAKYTMRGGNELTIQPDGTPHEMQTTGLDKDYITNWSYGLGETFTFISPNVKGGGSFYIGGSQFEPLLEMSDFPMDVKNNLLRSPAYWGDQPFTSGPTYIGVIVFLLAFLGLIFLKNGIKWPLFIIALLATALAWGKNFMPLTDFFIDHFPLYAKFRSVTMILILVELISVLVAVLFLEMMIKEKDYLKTKIKPIVGVVAGFFIFLLLVKMIGLKDGYMSQAERDQMAKIDVEIENNLRSYDPQMLKEQINLDINNPTQVQQYVAQQKQSYITNYDHVRKFRELIFKQSMNRTMIFTFFAASLILLFLFVNLTPLLFSSGMLLLVMVDMLPVANDYLGKQETNSGDYKYWTEKGKYYFPYSPQQADLQIMDWEIQANPELKKYVDQAEQKAIELADLKGYEGLGRQNMIQRYRFAELRARTNYRVYDAIGGFNSSENAFFHKALGGYHAAKLRSYQNLIEFQIANSNNKIFDMMNVKYVINKGQEGSNYAQQNYGAMGNAWMVKNVDIYGNPNDEIRALGMRFKIENNGKGTLLINDKETAETFVFGREKMNYILANDTIDIAPNKNMSEGMEVILARDQSGTLQWINPEFFEDNRSQEVEKIVKITADNDFKPKEEAVMLKEWANKLSQTTFSAQGTVVNTYSQPNKLVYEVDAKGKQLVVFSEIFYPKDWTVTIDGKPAELLKANYLLRAVEVPDGKHTVELAFDIPEFHALNKISFIGYIFLLLWIAGTIIWTMRSPTLPAK